MLIAEKKIWTPDNSSLLKYTAEIESGAILTGQELYIELQRLVDDLQCNDEYFYDTAAANLRIDFMENCIRLTKSPYYGQPLKLMLWQKAFTDLPSALPKNSFLPIISESLQISDMPTFQISERAMRYL